MTTGTVQNPMAAGLALTPRARLRRAGEHTVFGLLPVVVTVALIIFQFRLHSVAVDLRVAYWPAARQLLRGLPLYSPTPRQVAGGAVFVYPALSALVFTPFTLLTRSVAQAAYLLLGIACVPLTLRTLRVTDWRLYGMALLWSPTFLAWEIGNVTLPLGLLVALVWRHRQRPVVAGAVTAVAVSLKPFVWPLALWLLATRRWRAAAWALASGAAFNLLAWGLVGFNEIHAYLRVSGEVTTALWRQGYSLLAVAHHLGLGRANGEALLVAASVLLALAVLVAGVRRQRDRDALVLAIALMLVASPLLWAHYFALLLVPMAICRPRLGIAWALPILMWPLPPRQPVAGWEEVIAWGVGAAVTLLCLRAGERTGPATAPSPALAR